MCESIALSQDAKQIIYGGLLGDSHLHKRVNNIVFAHSEKQKEYLEWKRSFFNLNDVGDYRIYNHIYKGTFVTNISFAFRNKNRLFTNFYHKLRKQIYDKNHRKQVTDGFLRKLTPLGMAVWWMDDGCLSIHKGNRYGKLCTHGFNYDEHLLMQRYFMEKWDVKVDIKVEKRKYFFLRLNVVNLKKLITIIYPYVVQVPSLIYKIDLDYKNKIEMEDFKPIYDDIKKYIA